MDRGCDFIIEFCRVPDGGYRQVAVKLSEGFDRFDVGEIAQFNGSTLEDIWPDPELVAEFCEKADGVLEDGLPREHALASHRNGRGWLFDLRLVKGATGYVRVLCWGKPGVVCTPVTRRLSLDRSLRRALAVSGEFELHFQPIVDLQRGRVAALESLVRWNHPERGILGPDQFLDRVEELGLAPSLTRKVITMACRQIAAWRAEDHPAARCKVAVNMPLGEVASPFLFEFLRESMERCGCAGDQIVVEVTETGSMPVTDGVRAAFDAVSELGIELMMDDFGAGASTIARLADLPFRWVKFDKQFSAGIGREHARSDRFFEGLMAFVGANGLQVVAEGIEREEQVSLLRRTGCGFAQGHWFAKPASADGVASAILGAESRLACAQGGGFVDAWSSEAKVS